MSEDLGYIDRRIRLKLKKIIKRELHRDPLDFDLQITYAIQFAKEEFKRLLETAPVIRDYEEITILRSSLSYILEVERQANKKFPKLADLVKIYSSFFLIGAGLSFEAELPLNQHMLPLVVGTLTLGNSKRNWKKECFDPKVGQIKNECWKKIEENPQLFRAFKEEFKRIVDEKWKKRKKNRRMFLTHEIMVKFFVNKYILALICLNWDNLLELEYKRQTGHDISKVTSEGVIKAHSIWKLHGDVDDLKGHWVLLHRGGRIFNSLVEHIDSLKTPILVIIGYSEREINIANELIAKQETKRDTWRIRPDINPFLARENEIACTARYAMKTMNELLTNS